MKHPQPPDPASDCATHNGAMVESNPIQEAVKWLRSMAAIGNALPLGSSPRKHADSLARWADAIEAQTTTLRTALQCVRDTIESDPQNLNSQSISDTIWISPIETMVDYIDAALASDPAL